MQIVAYVPDLMDRSKVQAAGRMGGHDIVFVAKAADLADAEGELVLVDLGREGVQFQLAGLVSRDIRVVGFGSHVDSATLEAARDKGCEVHPRSSFFSVVLGEVCTAPR